MTARHRLITAVLIATLVFASCGGSEQAESTEAADAPTQDIEADTAAAQAALLTLSDFPEGWSELPAVDDSDNDESSRRLAECAGLDRDGMLDSPASAETGDFNDPEENLEVNQTVGLEATEQDAIDLMTGFAAPDLLTCVSAVYNDTVVDALDVPDDVEIGEITVARLNVIPAGDDVQASRVVIPFTTQGLEIDVIADLVLVRVGRSLSGLFFGSQFVPIPIETLDEYTALAASRLPG
jgi:hypothetical protein